MVQVTLPSSLPGQLVVESTTTSNQRSKNVITQNKAEEGGNLVRVENDKMGISRHNGLVGTWSPPESRDPEKGYSSYVAQRFHEEKTTCAPNATSHSNCSHVFDEDADAQKHALWILFYLSCLSPSLALLFSLYTLFTILFLLLASPLNVFRTTSPTLTHQIEYLLAPPLRFQLRLLYSPIDDDDSRTSISTRPTLLILINLLSPAYASCIAVSAWVAAVFWFYATILGDPDGNGNEDDGRAAVLSVKVWWEKWLRWGVRRQSGKGRSFG